MDEALEFQGRAGRSRREPTWVRVDAESDVSRAVAAARRCAEALGFREPLVCMVATAASELAWNICRHAVRGSLRVAPICRGERVGVELVAEDEGPGIPDWDLAMQDHWSTAGGLGIGLPGVRRLLDEIELERTGSRGSRIVGRKWQLPGAEPGP